MHRTNDLEWSEVVALVDNHAPVIINVMDGAHFVLVVGYDKPIGGDTLFVNDPGFNRPSCVSSLLPRSSPPAMIVSCPLRKSTLEGQ